mgnify:CR=1 FL=1
MNTMQIIFGSLAVLAIIFSVIKAALDIRRDVNESIAEILSSVGNDAAVSEFLDYDLTKGRKK